MATLVKRRINYTEMAHGTVCTVDPQWAKSWKRNLVTPIEREHDMGDEIAILITPDEGYMRGIINLKEESTGIDIPYIINSNAPGNNMTDTIIFRMPNDNVDVSVKFNKIIVI